MGGQLSNSRLASQDWNDLLRTGGASPWQQMRDTVQSAATSERFLLSGQASSK